MIVARREMKSTMKFILEQIETIERSIWNLNKQNNYQTTCRMNWIQIETNTI